MSKQQPHGMELEGANSRVITLNCTILSLSKCSTRCHCTIVPQFNWFNSLLIEIFHFYNHRTIFEFLFAQPSKKRERQEFLTSSGVRNKSLFLLTLKSCRGIIKCENRFRPTFILICFTFSSTSAVNQVIGPQYLY